MMHKRKIIIAAAILLVCVLLLISVSYAWFTMSVAPEVNGVTTNIGANGSLEIALLNDITFIDPSKISTTVGNSSAAVDATVSNLYWGSLLDLSDNGYGLTSIPLIPSRLNVYSNGEGGATIGSSMLLVPDYSTDGRFNSIITDTVSAVYNKEQSGFIYSTSSQSYGVRGIGTIDQLSSQEAALTNARAAIRSYVSASTSTMNSLWESNGAGLLRIYFDHYINGKQTFGEDEVALISSTASRLQTALSYTDLALRQGIIGYAASMFPNQEEFKSIRNTVENTSIPLSMIIEAATIELPDAITSSVSVIEEDASNLQLVINACKRLKGDNISWDIIGPMINVLLDRNGTYLENTKIANITPTTSLKADNALTISPSAGVMAHIADFTGNFSTTITYSESVFFRVGSVSTVSPANLVLLADELDDLTAAGAEQGEFTADLTQIYGYALDFAFRCNTACDLLLQTSPATRLGNDDENELTKGAGSYMNFVMGQLDEEQTVLVMDAIRVAFVDNRNNLLGIAKLNTSNYENTDNGIYAPLYLYDYTIERDGSITMGERLDDGAKIVSLQKNEATVITAIIWLDGDYVGNAQASINDDGLAGTLNLQFASSANLKPSEIDPSFD